MTLHHFAAYKIVGVISLGAGILFAFIEKNTTPIMQLVVVGSCIAAVPPTITGLFGLWLQHRTLALQRSDSKTLATVGEKVDGILSKAQTGEIAALKRADHAEGRREGVESEQERK